VKAELRDSALLLIYCAAIYWFSDRPVAVPLQSFPYQDKVSHLLTYTILAWLAWRALRHRCGGIRLAVLSLLFASLYGAMDEYHQSFVPERTAEVGDWLADSLGALLAVLWLFRGGSGGRRDRPQR